MNATVLLTPPLRLAALPSQVRNSVLAAIQDAGNPVSNIWREKLRRFASLYGRRLRTEARSRFGGDCDMMLSWIGDCLLLAAEVSEYKGQAPTDSAFLSAAAYCVDALQNTTRHKELDIKLTLKITKYREWLLATAPQASLFEPLGPDLSFSFETWRAESIFADGIVIIGPSPYSLFTISVFELCRRLNIPVKAILLKRFTLDRFREEWRRDGMIVLNKIWRKIIIRGDESSEYSEFSLNSVHKSLDVNYADVRKLATELGVPVLAVDNFNDIPVSLPALRPGLAIFTGGGLISERFLGAFTEGIVNVHHGHLPQFKGMDVVHAPVLEGRFGTVGMTAHIMSSGLDEGAVLERCSVSPESYRSINTLRNALSALMPILAIDAMLGYFSKRLPLIQQQDSGRQYFFLHPRMTKILNDRLRMNIQSEDAYLRRTISDFVESFGKK